MTNRTAETQQQLSAVRSIIRNSVLSCSSTTAAVLVVPGYIIVASGVRFSVAGSRISGPEKKMRRGETVLKPSLFYFLSSFLFFVGCRFAVVVNTLTADRQSHILPSSSLLFCFDPSKQPVRATKGRAFQLIHDVVRLAQQQQQLQSKSGYYCCM